MQRLEGCRWSVEKCSALADRPGGGVKLEAMRIGGTMYTSVEALGRFGLRLNDGASETHSLPESSARQRHVDQASQRLHNLLGTAPSEEKDRDPAHRRRARTPKR